MKIISTSVLAYDQGIVFLTVELENEERIQKGDVIAIERMDDTTIMREIICVKHDCRLKAKQIRECKVCEHKPQRRQAVGPCRVSLVVLDVNPRELKSEENIQAQEIVMELQRMICLTPYKELHMGDLSIYDYVENGYFVTDRVLLYLQTTQPFMMAPGIYAHPFKKDMNLMGPYLYTDGLYYWDRDTWKYVVKYGLKLPREFIHHVMSQAGEAFLKQFAEENDSWGKRVVEWKEQVNTFCLLPEDAGDIPLDEF